MDALTHCPVCRRELPPHARYCPVCGANLATPLQAASNPPPIPSGSRVPPTGLLPAQHSLHGRYLIERKLAQGGQSAVYLVLDTALGNVRRAVKEMSQATLMPAERERAINHFFREAQMLAQLDHPTLAKVYEYFVEGDKHYLAMEYVPGHTLEDEMIELGRPLEWASVVRWGVQLCDVLAYLHAQRPPIIYRDLKPANVMLTPNGDLKLIDFGIARRLISPRARDTAQLGTDGYAPLEQYASKSEPRSDLYALGASLYHLLTGRVPESAPMRSGGGPLTPIRSVNPRVPEAVEQSVLRALSLHPDDRFQSAAAMGEALDRLAPLASPPLPAPPAGPPPVTPPTSAGRMGAVRPPSAARGAARASSGPATSKLHVWPLRLDGGTIEVGNSATLELEVGNRGDGALNGHIETNSLSLLVQPARVDDNTSHLEVRIDTAGLVPGAYVLHVAVRTNGGDQIVPVRFVVQAGQPGGEAARPAQGR